MRANRAEWVAARVSIPPNYFCPNGQPSISISLPHLRVLGSGSANTFIAIVGPELVRWCAGDCGGRFTAAGPEPCSDWAALDTAPPLFPEECGDGLCGDERFETSELSLLLLLLMPLPCVEWRVDMAGAGEGDEGRELFCGGVLLSPIAARVGLWYDEERVDGAEDGDRRVWFRPLLYDLKLRHEVRRESGRKGAELAHSLEGLSARRQRRPFADLAVVEAVRAV